MIRTVLLAALVTALAGHLIIQRATTASADHLCGEPGFEFDTYEYENYINDYGKAIELAAAGHAVTFAYSIGEESVDLRYQGLLSGPRDARKPLSTEHKIPPTILKSIVWIESNFANAADSVPWGGVGPILRSHDCGYGLGQITTGMSRLNGNNPTAKQAIIGTHSLFNLAEGVRILADKWNSAPQYRPIAGTGDPSAIEDWYFAIWSYNGFASVNHPFGPINNEPLSPLRDPLRAGSAKSPIYHCYDTTAPSWQESGTAILYGYGDYTYPERVYGCMAYPPVKNGQRLWAPQVFNMPDFTIPAVARAFNYDTYYFSCFSGCAVMDYPTTIPEFGVVTHKDTTPPIDPAEARRFLGDPVLAFSGSTSVNLTVYKDGTVSPPGTFTLSNTGVGIAPYRIRTSAPWLVVRHATDPATRKLSAGVAIGKETEVVVLASPNRVAQAGYQSNLIVTVNPALLPPGSNVGTVTVEPLLGGGGVTTINVVATSGASSFQYRAVLPQLTSEGVGR